MIEATSAGDCHLYNHDVSKSVLVVRCSNVELDVAATAPRIAVRLIESVYQERGRSGRRRIVWDSCTASVLT
jgi:hypothetical protein